jgi:hypothetical protein
MGNPLFFSFLFSLRFLGVFGVLGERFGDRIFSRQERKGRNGTAKKPGAGCETFCLSRPDANFSARDDEQADEKGWAADKRG